MITETKDYIRLECDICHTYKLFTEDSPEFNTIESLGEYIKRYGWVKTHNRRLFGSDLLHHLCGDCVEKDKREGL